MLSMGSTLGQVSVMWSHRDNDHLHQGHSVGGDLVLGDTTVTPPSRGAGHTTEIQIDTLHDTANNS